MRSFIAECLEQCANGPVPLKKMATQLGSTEFLVRRALQTLRRRGLASYTKGYDIARATPTGRRWVKNGWHLEDQIQ
jgi:Mn-dependent DtxR family transcriptional regulator